MDPEVIIMKENSDILALQMILEFILKISDESILLKIIYAYIHKHNYISNKTIERIMGMYAEKLKIVNKKRSKNEIADIIRDILESVKSSEFKCALMWYYNNVFEGKITDVYDYVCCYTFIDECTAEHIDGIKNIIIKLISVLSKN